VPQRTRSGAGTTTVTNPSPEAAAELRQGLAITWAFPDGQAPTRLDTSEPAELVFGRDPECDVVFDSHDVSRRHARLRLGAGGARDELEDMGSRNGTRVNCRPIERARLTLGDVVRFGGAVGVVCASVEPFRELGEGLFGSGALHAAFAPLEKAAASDLPVVLEGETGTGKEVVARSLHRASRRSGPFLAVNCAALPEGLAEAELFGYRRGAFTGADRASPGFFRSADGGTLLLDEVSDLPLPLQAKLLRVLEQREVQPLGEARPVPVDVRVVVAGQETLEDAVKRRAFRADLFARLDGVSVRIPPLRARREDIAPLFRHFLRAFGGERPPSADADFVERLVAHDFPFNVRELVLLARRLLVLHGSEPVLGARHLPARIGDRLPAVPVTTPPVSAVEVPAPATVDLAALLEALRNAGGNVARASAALGITRQRAYRLMDGHAVDLEALREENGDAEAQGPNRK
jgi:transcriptional regulator with AAA-type ATPase domain